MHGVRLLRLLHVGHRWLGVGLGAMVLLWFVSGVVMLFVARPKLTEIERLQALPRLELTAIALPPLAAWQALGRPGWPEAVRLNTVAGRPVYHFLADGQWSSVDAVSGTPRAVATADQAKAAALAFVKAGRTVSTQVAELTRDQWTLSSRYNALRPFYRVELDDPARHDIYVSRRTGEIALDTDFGERAWNWVGTVIHWLYFTPLREQGVLWRNVVLWGSAAALLLALGGIWLGWQRLHLKKRYPEGRITPYRAGWKRWHHLLGLGGGLFLLTWLLSGWLSLAPFGWVKGNATSPLERKNLAGGELDAGVLGRAPLLRVPQTVVEIKWIRFHGKPYLLLNNAEGKSWLSPPDRDAAQEFLALPEIVAAGQSVLPQATLRGASWLSEGDSDYFAHRHRPLTLPVVRLQFDDADNTLLYIDPASGQLLRRIDDAARLHRWLFGALHRLDFPPLDGSGPAREALVIVLSLGAGGLAWSGCLLGWRRIRRRGAPANQSGFQAEHAIKERRSS